MRLQDFIIGIMAFVLVTIVTLLLTFDLYDSDSLNIDLDSDNYTQSLGDLQDEVNDARANISNTNAYLRKNAIGGEDVDLPTPEMTEADLISSSLEALGRIPTYFNIFMSMMRVVFGSLGLLILDFFWFFTGAIIIIITLLLLSSVLRNRL